MGPPAFRVLDAVRRDLATAIGKAESKGKVIRTRVDGPLIVRAILGVDGETSTEARADLLRMRQGGSVQGGGMLGSAEGR